MSSDPPDTALWVFVKDTLWIVSCTVVAHGTAVCCVVLFIDGNKAIGFERTGTFNDKAHVIVGGLAVTCRMRSRMWLLVVLILGMLYPICWKYCSGSTTASGCACDR